MTLGIIYKSDGKFESSLTSIFFFGIYVCNSCGLHNQYKYIV